MSNNWEAYSNISDCDSETEEHIEMCSFNGNENEENVVDALSNHSKKSTKYACTIFVFGANFVIILVILGLILYQSVYPDTQPTQNKNSSNKMTLALSENTSIYSCGNHSIPNVLCGGSATWTMTFQSQPVEKLCLEIYVETEMTDVVFGVKTSEYDDKEVNLKQHIPVSIFCEPDNRKHFFHCWNQMIQQNMDVTIDIQSDTCVVDLWRETYTSPSVSMSYPVPGFAWFEPLYCSDSPTSPLYIMCYEVDFALEVPADGYYLLRHHGFFTRTSIIDYSIPTHALMWTDELEPTEVVICNDDTAPTNSSGLVYLPQGLYILTMRSNTIFYIHALEVYLQ